jgi:hypothetical protein
VFSVPLQPGDLLFIDWNVLEGRPRSSYQVVASDDEGFHYYRIGVNKVMRTTYDGINFALSRGEMSATIYRPPMAQA